MWGFPTLNRSALFDISSSVASTHFSGRGGHVNGTIRCGGVPRSPSPAAFCERVRELHKMQGGNHSAPHHGFKQCWQQRGLHFPKHP